MNPIITKGYNLFQSKVLGKERPKVFWHIHSNEPLNSENLGKIGSFADAHPNDIFVVSTNQAKHKNEFGFTKLNYERPNDKALMNLLEDKKVATNVIKNIFKYHNHSIEYLSDLVNYDNPHDVFNQYF